MTEWALVLESTELPRKGERIFVTGNPRGVEGVFSEGRISGQIPEAHHGLGALTFTAPISPGSSGCPVVNGRGAVVGVVTSFVREGQNLNIATPIDWLFFVFTKFDILPSCRGPCMLKFYVLFYVSFSLLEDACDTLVYCKL